MRSPSKDGAFASIISYDQLLSNIGGFSDDNNNLTRRILFLLESDWLYNENLLAELRKEIINRYVRASITQHALCRFLLNDIIRYYRTLCVDFEFKTCETDKSWGDRNIKLAFSRKLMYFSGVLVLAETVQQTCEKKRSILNECFSKDPIRRLTDICGIQAEKALKYYDQFLQALSDESSRELLQRTTDDRDNHSEEFRNLKNMGHHFSWELFNVLNKTYPPSHPIHMCLCI